MFMSQDFVMYQPVLASVISLPMYSMVIWKTWILNKYI